TLCYTYSKNFIYKRLFLIYKSIQINQKAYLPFNESIDSMIFSAKKEVLKWKDVKNNEITRLKDQEVFRREFLGNLAHELKTPVFSIQGYILTLLEGGLEDPNVNRSFLERAAKATDRMATILEDLDQITKLEVDELKMEMRSFDLVDLISEIFESLELSSQTKNIKLKFDKFYAPIYVTADRVKIGQVFTNLIGNSIAYGKEGGETKINLLIFESLVTVEVIDNGPGIEDKEIPRLFERFYRVEKSRNRNEGGSGLGLAIVKHILESHGQSISVRSKIGIGSTFSFSLDKSSNNGPVSSRGIPLK
ncbi:MAG: sensor histidine kinase, partial [Crocinitomicaceae bacterium]|nr:sensor histidine kinase [Crocinitomicaceae bacterium]